MGPSLAVLYGSYPLSSFAFVMNWDLQNSRMSKFPLIELSTTSSIRGKDSGTWFNGFGESMRITPFSSTCLDLIRICFATSKATTPPNDHPGEWIRFDTIDEDNIIANLPILVSCYL